MRTIVHISDLHFGRTDPVVLGPLRERISADAPDLVVVSGDLTQRARPREFEDARAFLEALPGSKLVIPGNHDVPLFNPFLRFFDGLGAYRRYVTRDLRPFHRDDEIAVMGVNTARSLAISEGRMSRAQLDAMADGFRPVPPHVARILVTHHPFDLPRGAPSRGRLGRVDRAILAAADAGVDIVLSGHLHRAHSAHSATRLRTPHRAVLFVQAGTATSTRVRGEPNSWNLLHLDDREVIVERRVFSPARRAFETVDLQRFRRDTLGWASEPGTLRPDVEGTPFTRWARS
jgi:3',5'-cyclic AMP phosphodiesterase CpdA